MGSKRRYWDGIRESRDTLSGSAFEPSTQTPAMAEQQRLNDEGARERRRIALANTYGNIVKNFVRPPIVGLGHNDDFGPARRRSDRRELELDDSRDPFEHGNAD